jgi:hypothetical protein
MTSDPATRDGLFQGESLTPGQSLTSSDGCFTLKLEDTGNLVLSDRYSRNIWESKTTDATALTLTTNGRLVLNDSKQYWERKGDNDVSAPSLVVQTDGNIVLLTDSGKVYWASDTAVPATPKPPATPGVLGPGEGLSLGESLYSANRRFRLVLEMDGNLVEYSQSRIWEAKSATDLTWRVMMEDGYLVLRDAHQNTPWQSDTAGKGVELKLHDNGKLAIYDAEGNAIWPTK